MIAPLDVPAVVAAHLVENDMRTRTTVVDIAQDMQLVDGEALDDIGDGNDEIIGTAGRDDGIYDDIDVCRLVMIFGMLVEQFLDDIGEIARQRLAHLGTGILAGNITTYSHQAVERDVIPVINVLLVVLDEFEFLLRVIDEGAQVALLLLSQGSAEEFVHLTLDVTRSVFQNMQESLVLAVDVGKEMFCALRQIEDSLEIDNLSAGFCYRRKRLRQQLQISYVFFNIVLFHNNFIFYEC